MILPPVNERSTSIVKLFLHDSEGVAIPAANVTAITLTLKDKVTGTPINSRTAQNVLNTNNCTYVSRSGEVTDATNATPIVVTSAGHGNATGDYVHVAGCEGNTAANNTKPSGTNLLWRATKIDDNRFSLDGSSGNGAYSSIYIPERGSWSAGVFTWNMQALDNIILANALPEEIHVATLVVTAGAVAITHEFEIAVKNLGGVA